MRYLTSQRSLPQARWWIAAVVIALLSLQVASTQHHHPLNEHVVCDTCHSGVKAIAVNVPAVGRIVEVPLRFASLLPRPVTAQPLRRPPTRAPPTLS